MTATSSSVSSAKSGRNQPSSLRAVRRWLLWSGIGLLLTGLAAVIFPMTATLVTETFIGWVFIFAGVAAAVRAFSNGNAGIRWGALALSVLYILTGVYLIANPVAGAVAITLIIATLLIVDGVLGIAAALYIRHLQGWGWLFASSIISLMAGVLVASGLPGTSLILIGIIVGFTLICNGIACLAGYRALGSHA